MSSTPDQTHRPARLVVADDETHIRLVVAEKFRAAGHVVFEARDGEEALDLVREHRPDAIITDLQMPYMSGLELCERVAQDAAAENRTPPSAVLLTARGHILEPDQLQRTVIRRVIGKPFGVRDLLDYVQTQLLGRAPAKPDPSSVPVECRAA